jgi:hypothetical protein
VTGSRQTPSHRVAKAPEQVFINCPFDEGYKPIFDAIVFAITDLGFLARSAREEDDGGETRLAKIQRMIRECRYGVHDLSAVELDQRNNLPRFNMPLELELFLGCKFYGGNAQRSKKSLILDTEQYRFQLFISDLAGIDIHAHGGRVDRAIGELRTWLATESNHKYLPGGNDIFEKYELFLADFPTLCAEARLRPAEVTFIEFRQMTVDWLRINR